MVPLKEDRSLDLEAINKLSHFEFPKIVNTFTSKQHEYFYSHLIINENQNHVKDVKFCPYDEVIKRGWGVDADEFLQRMRDKYLKN